MTLELKPIKIENTRMKHYDYSKFVKIVKQAIKAMESKNMDAAGFKWDTISAFLGAKVKIHSFFAHKEKEIFKDNKGNTYSIKDVEKKFNIVLTGDRTTNLFKVKKI